MSSPSQTTEPIARTFIDHARNYLVNDYLPKIERCLEGLTDEQIWWRANDASNSIGNLLLHLCGNARQWIVSGLGNAPDRRVRQAEFDQRDVIERAELLRRLKETLADVDNVLSIFDEHSLLQTYVIQGSNVTALEAILHVTEHFSMHTGQIIMLTKMMNSSDLTFYEFEGGVPVRTWRNEEP